MTGHAVRVPRRGGQSGGGRCSARADAHGEAGDGGPTGALMGPDTGVISGDDRPCTVRIAHASRLGLFGTCPATPSSSWNCPHSHAKPAVRAAQVPRYSSAGSPSKPAGSAHGGDPAVGLSGGGGVAGSAHGGDVAGQAVVRRCTQMLEACDHFACTFPDTLSRIVTPKEVHSMTTCSWSVPTKAFECAHIDTE